MATETANIRSSSVDVPRRIDRNPSTTLVIGFKLQSNRQRSGTRLVGYATGVTKPYLEKERNDMLYVTIFYIKSRKTNANSQSRTHSQQNKSG
jgi:hypothetical protein